MKIANIYGYDGGNFGGNVYDINDVSPAINCMGGWQQDAVNTIGR